MSRHRSSATLLALAWAVLVLYASLYPFSGWRWPPGQGLWRLLQLPWPPYWDDFDIAANLLGYLPLGVLALIAARRSGVRTGPSVLLATALPAGLSFATEVAQACLPGRHPSLKDWVLNSGGAAAGVLLGAALHRLRWIERWQSWRERWFVQRSAGALALLTLWPFGLLFPAPVPLGLGQVGPRLRQWLLDGLHDVPWAHDFSLLLAQGATESHPMWPLAEGGATTLGLLAPCLLAFAVVDPGWRRLVLLGAALLLTLLGMTLSTALNFGPHHALAWLTPATLPALLSGSAIAMLLVPVGRRVAAGLALVVLTGLVMLVAQAPSDPYFAQSLQAWEQGRFVRFHGLSQWIGWLWPYAAMAWLLSRFGSGASSS